MATRLSVPRILVKDLRIRYEVFRKLLRLLLAIQSSDDQPDAAMKDLITLDFHAKSLLCSAGSEGEEDIGFEGFEKIYEALGRSEGLLENQLRDELHVDTPNGKVKLKPDLLQGLAKVFEAFIVAS